MDKIPILLVDADQSLREALGEQLDLTHEFITHTAATLAEGFELASRQPMGLALLDIQQVVPQAYPSAPAFARQSGLSCPIIMIGHGADSDAETIHALDGGANDYMPKPLRVGVLVARMRAHLRAAGEANDRPRRLGRFQFYAADKQLIDEDGSRIRLTDKETEILRYLYRAGPITVPREVLLAEVWSYSAQIATHTLETHIYRLRRKIEADPKAATLLITDEGGYRLVP
jgi:DNA-binding response OmpR family regulator